MQAKLNLRNAAVSELERKLEVIAGHKEAELKRLVRKKVQLETLSALIAKLIKRKTRAWDNQPDGTAVH